MKYTRMRDISVDLQVCSDDTGYEYDFLCQMVEMLVSCGRTYERAVFAVKQRAYSHSF